MFKRNTQLNDYRKDGRLAYNSFIKKTGGNIVRVNKKTKDLHTKYSRLREEYLKVHPICEFPLCGCAAEEIHHKKGRIGRNMWFHWMGVCKIHHRYIHDNPIESFENGWLIKNN